MATRITLLALPAVLALEGLAQIPAQPRAAVESYRAAIESARASRSLEALEATLDRLDAVRDALMRVDKNRATLVETLSEAEFQELERDLPGVLLSREEITFVNLDPDWFLDFASSHKKLAESTCACDDVATVEKELQLFLHAFPNSPIASRVNERLRAVRDGRSDIRYRCVSG